MNFMYLKKQFQLITLIANLLLVISVFAPQVPAQTPHAEVLSDADRDSIFAVVKHFFAAYSQKDVAAWRTLWSVRSPYFNTSEEEVKAIFENARELEAAVFNSERAVVENGEVSVVMDVELKGKVTDAQKGVGYYRSGRWVLVFKRDAGQWKIVRRISAERDLAIRLVDSKTQAESTVLNASASRFGVRMLVGAILSEANERMATISFSELERIYQIALERAKLSGEPRAVIDCENWIASKYAEKGDFRQAENAMTRALELSRSTGDKSLISEMLSALGILNGRNDLPRQSLDYFLEASVVRDSAGLGASWVFLYRIGQCYSEMGEIGRASCRERV